MRNYSIKEALPIIINAAKEYDSKLCDRHFLIIYKKDNQIESCEVGFRDYNFLHLTGIKTSLSAQQFYNACINGKLSVNDISISSDGKTQQKLAVLPYLSELLYNRCMIGDFINSGISIRADYFVGDTKAIISVGFRSNSSVDFPVSLYNDDIRKLSNPTCQVLAIYSKRYNETNYTDITYCIKDFDKSILPSNILDRIVKQI